MFKRIDQFFSRIGRKIARITKRVVERAKPALKVIARRVGAFLLELLIAKIAGPAPATA